MDVIEWLSHPKNAELVVELNETIAAATKATVEHDKPATVTVAFDIRPIDHGEMGTVVVQPTVKSKLPAATRAAGVWFVTELSRANPAQLTLEQGLAKAAEDLGVDIKVIPPVGTAEGEIPNE